MAQSPRRGDNFQTANYLPAFGDVVHLNWSPSVGHEMPGPHYGLVVSATRFAQATGLVLVVPITSKTGKRGGFELPVRAGRVNGAAILSGLRSVDYQTRDVQYEDRVQSEDRASPSVADEAARRIKMLFPDPSHT